eukprot:scaffold5347_cov130-Cylindrotheca_fusiformis.AAC.8
MGLFGKSKKKKKQQAMLKAQQQQQLAAKKKAREAAVVQEAMSSQRPMEEEKKDDPAMDYSMPVTSTKNQHSLNETLDTAGSEEAQDKTDDDPLTEEEGSAYSPVANSRKGSFPRSNSHNRSPVAVEEKEPDVVLDDWDPFETESFKEWENQLGWDDTPPQSNEEPAAFVAHGVEGGEDEEQQQRQDEEQQQYVEEEQQVEEETDFPDLQERPTDEAEHGPEYEEQEIPEELPTPEDDVKVTVAEDDPPSTSPVDEATEEAGYSPRDPAMLDQEDVTPGDAELSKEEEPVEPAKDEEPVSEAPKEEEPVSEPPKEEEPPPPPRPSIDPKKVLLNAKQAASDAAVTIGLAATTAYTMAVACAGDLQAGFTDEIHDSASIGGDTHTVDSRTIDSRTIDSHTIDSRTVDTYNERDISAMDTTTDTADYTDGERSTYTADDRSRSSKAFLGRVENESAMPRVDEASTTTPNATVTDEEASPKVEPENNEEETAVPGDSSEMSARSVAPEEKDNAAPTMMAEEATTKEEPVVAEEPEEEAVVVDEETTVPPETEKIKTTSAGAGEYYPLADLQAKAVEGIDNSRREEYLSPEDFQATFSMTLEEFAKQPPWKRELAKKRAQLF